jgi:hypothetical protein
MTDTEEQSCASCGTTFTTGDWQYLTPEGPKCIECFHDNDEAEA